MRDLGAAAARPTAAAGKLEIVTDRSGEEALDLIRHDAAHVLAAAVLELYPGVKISIGPPIENGFYYDFEFPDWGHAQRRRLPGDRGEDARAHHGRRGRSCARTSASSDALERFRDEEQDYKVELIEDLVRDADPRDRSRLSAVHQRPVHRPVPRPALRRAPSGSRRSSCSRSPAPTGAATPTGRCSRACTGPRSSRPRSSRSTWSGSSGPAPTTTAGSARSSGCSPSPRSRRARRSGFRPGTQVFNALVALSREMGARARLRRGQDAAALRQLAVEDLRPLGQVRREHVRDRVRGPADGAQADELSRPLPALLAAAALLPGPAACATPSPGCCTAASRAARCTACCASRHFAQDDAHIFCTEEQIQDEVAGVHASSRSPPTRCSGSTSGSSSRPAPSSGSARTSCGIGARRRCSNALESHGLEYDLNAGDGAFYGPKIDMHMTDSLGRSWQLGTCQLDYNMPERFGLTYTGADNAEHQPVMIHRALMGSYERFIGILLEHFAGELPLWLAPVQAIVLPIADRHNDYAQRGRSAGCMRPACAPSSTIGPSRSGARSATPSCGRSRSCSSSATASRSRARSACASTAAATRARSVGGSTCSRSALEDLRRNPARRRASRSPLYSALR